MSQIRERWPPQGIGAADTRVGTIVLAASNSIDPTLAPNLYRCTGADDEVTWLAAETYAAAVGGMVVALEGLYTFGATCALTVAGVTWRGMGYSSHVTGAGNFSLFTISGINDIVIENMRLSQTSIGNMVDCIFIEDGSDRFHINRVWITDSDQDGIHIEGTNIYNGWITENYITGTDRDGVQVNMDGGNAMYNLVVTANIIYQAGDDAIDITLANYCVITSNSLYDPTDDGIEIDSFTGGTITGNMIFEPGGQGINCDNVSDYLLVSSNGIYDATGIGIEFNACSYTLCLGNNIYNAHTGIDWTTEESGVFLCNSNLIETTTTGAGISATNADYSRILINGNIVRNSSGVGINTAVFDGNVTVVGNYSELGTIGIYTNSKGTLIVGNMCVDNDGSGIYVGNVGDESLIHGNYLLNNDEYGIDLVANADGCDVRDNYYDGNGITPIRDLATGTRLATRQIQLIQGTTFVSTAGEAWGWSITADTNFALGIGWLPLEVQQVVRIRVIGVALAAPGAGDYMRIQITGEGATFAEDFATEPIDVVDHNNEEVNVQVDEVVNWVFTAADDADIGDLLGGDRLQIKILHEGAGNGDAQTNAIVDTIQVEYV